MRPLLFVLAISACATAPHPPGDIVIAPRPDTGNPTPEPLPDADLAAWEADAALSLPADSASDLVEDVAAE